MEKDQADSLASVRSSIQSCRRRVRHPGAAEWYVVTDLPSTVPAISPRNSREAVDRHVPEKFDLAMKNVKTPAVQNGEWWMATERGFVVPAAACSTSLNDTANSERAGILRPGLKCQPLVQTGSSALRTGHGSPVSGKQRRECDSRSNRPKLGYVTDLLTPWFISL